MSLLSKRSLSSILSGFNKTLKDLQSLIDHNNAEAAKKTAEIKKLDDEKTALTQEATQAAVVKGNIEKLLSTGNPELGA